MKRHSHILLFWLIRITYSNELYRPCLQIAERGWYWSRVSQFCIALLRFPYSNSPKQQFYVKENVIKYAKLFKSKCK